MFGALRAGASGFLLKDAPRERLLKAIRVVHQGEALLSPSITRRLVEDYADRADPVRPAPGLLAALTPREREMLLLVAQGLSNQEIAALLAFTEATVKLHLRDRVQAVVLAYEHGIVVPGRRPDPILLLHPHGLRLPDHRGPFPPHSGGTPVGVVGGRSGQRSDRWRGSSSG
ncbi:hypothetical protein GCM10009678_91420 [Actinomadura kijaniata]|uniref:DNA-binding CsgD family transcriptional regulator n=1 Tax=Actinomadura namibiensis TaxID=182080 RepID=A0A7W3M0J6_ACTNM|nr:response regulator transcription factor [Actinomadura namibiensis]MBA8957768.1 DNA-binding CsgD family transcriptional regulator [Actinomadura namibiensis]